MDKPVMSPPGIPMSGLDQTVLVFQGGGALGAYQAGVYQAMHEAGIEPNWVIGTSIGAINAALIVGNSASDRLPALKDFWARMTHKSALFNWPGFERFAQFAANMQTVSGGIGGFFEPNLEAMLWGHLPLDPERAGYYSTAPLEATLASLIDFGRLNAGPMRLTVGAAHVRTSEMRYFDTREDVVSAKHILASGALPPAFPPVRIDGDLYWDGGILSNTPTEVIFDDNPRRNSLVFAVHMWNPNGPEPTTMSDVAHRQKDIQYSSRVATHIARQAQIHRLRHIIKELANELPEDRRRDPAIRELTAYGCLTRMHVVRLLAPSLEYEDQTKDIDFSPAGVKKRWLAGYDHTRRAIDLAPWTRPVDPLGGVFLHEVCELPPQDQAYAIMSTAAEQPSIKADNARTPDPQTTKT